MLRFTQIILYIAVEDNFIKNLVMKKIYNGPITFHNFSNIKILRSR